jgi:alpha/beta superfamily hydrolase
MSIDRLRFETGGGLALEGELRLPPGGAPPRAGVSFATAHPRHGGSMRAALVSRVGQAVVADGLAFLRWHFRGSGASEGVHTDGELEPGDVRAAAGVLAGRGIERIILAGWSFGGDMSLRAAPGVPGAVGVIAVGPPLWWVKRHHVAALAEWGRPVRFVLCERDELRPPAVVAERMGGLPDLGFTVLPGADHLLTTGTDEAVTVVAGYAAELA